MITLILIGSILSVIAAVWAIIRQQRHLEDRVIRDFMANRLSTKARNQVISHLGICEACQKKLHDYNEGKPIEDHLIDED